MRLSFVNPLDQSPLPAPPSILVHTQSIIHDIKSGDNAIVRLLKIAALKTCPIVFTPVADKEVNQILADFNLDVASYFLQNHNYIIKSAYIEAAFSAETNTELAESFEEKQGYNLNDSMLMSSGYFHYHLSKAAPRATDIGIILDILQVYHVKNRIFKAYPNQEVGQFVYDMLSTNKQLPAYKTLFRAYYLLNTANPAEKEIVENLLQSLYDRMMLMNKSVIELKYHSLKTVNNNASTEIMYHVSYFVILVTSSFDNMAWIINYLFGLGFSLSHANKIQVKWQNVYNHQDKPKDKYYKALLPKAPAIYNYLLTDPVSCLIDFIYPLRDAIQHRSFIKPLTVGANVDNTKLLIWFPDDVKKTLVQRNFLPEEFGFQKEISGLMNRDYYDIYLLSKKVHREVIELVNTVCKLINSSTTQPSAQDLQKLAQAKLDYDKDPLVGVKAQEALVY